MVGFQELGLAFLFTLATAGLSLLRRDAMGKEILISTIRTILQVLLLGYVLTWIFKHPTLPVIFFFSALMTINSAIHSRSRVKRKYKGLLLDSLLANALTIWPLAVIGSLIMNQEPWWRPDLFLPLLGMLLGNVLNGISLGVDQFTHEVHSKKEEVLSDLAIGASPTEATGSAYRRSLRLAMTPVLNAMASMGVVSIPGTMLGQILGGQPPQEAALVQIMIMIFVCVGVYAGAIFGICLSRRRLFDERGLPCF